MSLDELSSDLAPFARALVDAAAGAGLQPQITSTLRTRSQQRRLYAGYLANPQRAYPVVPPGFSAHEYGEAFDMVVTPLEALGDVGYTWQTWGGGWNPRDAVHFELPGASERAAQRGAASQPVGALGRGIADVLEWFDSLPWYLQILLPTRATIQREPARYTKNILAAIIDSYR